MSVAEIQDALRAAGFDPGVTDGKNGPKTQAAVRAYQAANGLAVDGIAGPLTQAKLGGGASSGGDITKAVADNYPDMLWAVNDPDIGPILKKYADAANAGQKWSDGYLQSQLSTTDWWKNNSAAARKYLGLLGSDPKEAAVQLNAIGSAQKYVALAASMGMDYNFEGALNQVQRVVRGEVTSDQLAKELSDQAKALYPALAQTLDKGGTVDDAFAPYRSLAVKLLGVNPADVKISDPKWQQMLMVSDPQGQRRLASTDEAERILRTDGRFGYQFTQGARDEAFTAAQGIKRMWGMEAGAA